MNEKLISEVTEKLKAKFPGSETHRLMESGKYAEAQNSVAGMMWGIWAEIGAASGLPCDDTARQAWIDKAAAKRAAKFKK